jgi:hypothetical protein
LNLWKTPRAGKRNLVAKRLAFFPDVVVGVIGGGKPGQGPIVRLNPVP